MQVIETQATVSPEGELTVQVRVPATIKPGPHRVIVVLEETANAPEPVQPLTLPRLPVTSWPADLSLRREDLYDDSGR
jgi:hypothetical protein